MTRRDRDRVTRWLGRGLVAIVSLYLVWSIVANTAALSLARGDPERALRWGDAEAAALVFAAENRLTTSSSEADLVAVGRLAERALLADPLEERALRLMALVADLQGSAERAATLMDAAARRSLRDAAAHGWLFNQRTRSGDAAAALDHADVLMRAYPDLAERLLPSLVAFAGDNDARSHLVDALATDPPWRRWLLGKLPRQSDEPVTAFAVLSDLRSAGSPPTNSELAPYLSTLIEAGQYELAYLAWVHFLAGKRPTVFRYAYNGDFEREVSGLPFDWAISRVDGATTEVAARSDSNAALHVVFADTRVNYHNVAKLLVLPPGDYRLSGAVMASDLLNERGLAWRISCAGGTGRIIGESPRARGTMSWRPFERTFRVPSSGCRAQWLKLVLAARTAIEQQVSGEIWYDDLRIERVAVGAPASRSN